MKQAFYADYIYYESKLYNSSWLIVNKGIVDGIKKTLDNQESYDIKKFVNSAIFPGLINTHNHLGMSLFRGMADDLPLMTWLKDYIWPVEKKYVSYDFVYLGTLLSIAESIRCGTTCLNDMYFFSNAATDAVRKAGVRAVIGLGIFNDIEKSLKSAEDYKECEFVKAALAPHALYTVTPDKIKMCVDFARSKNYIIHTHLAETLDENKEIKDKYGKSPVELMDETGALDYKGIFAHCVHLSDSDINLLGRKQVSISHCLESNLKLASGFAPVKKLMDAGANVSIGTDGAASNNDQSMINEMSTVAKFHKALNMDATTFADYTVLNMATKNAAKGLCYDKIGSLECGNYADFFVLSFDAPHMTPMYDPVSHLIYASQNSDVTDVYIKGKPVMTDKRILSFDEEAVKNKARNMIKKFIDR